ncbi:MAG: hypothetical protein Q9164_005795 [Protoblastenia rupestris]
MATSNPNPTYPNFSSLYTHIQNLPPPLTPPPKPTSPSLTPKIAALSLHPTLEAALHILNNDLPAAHFLVRHMQSAPAFEGMFLHGILHRIEGDYDNARAWYSNVKDSEVFAHAWEGGEEQAKGFIDRIEGFVKRKEEGDKEGLERESLREIKAVVGFCREKFGDGEVRDASEAFVRSNEKHRKIGEEMVSGDKGFRKF